MAEELVLPKTQNRKEIYESLLPQIRALTAGEGDLIANMANISAVLKTAFNFFWVGFYLVKEDQLVLGPFQGPLACTRIAFNKGVCGACYSEGKSQLVPDVNVFPGHIACSSESLSEVVIPVFNTKKEIIAVLDVDSNKLNDFTETDLFYLEEMVKVLA